jgi:hypothetical protein
MISAISPVDFVVNVPQCRFPFSAALALLFVPVIDEKLTPLPIFRKSGESIIRVLRFNKIFVHCERLRQTVPSNGKLRVIELVRCERVFLIDV